MTNLTKVEKKLHAMAFPKSRWVKTIDKLDEVRWKNQKSDLTVSIIKFWSWEFMVYTEDGRRLKFKHSISSKAQALVYAKKYMKEN